MTIAALHEDFISGRVIPTDIVETQLELASMVAHEFNALSCVNEEAALRAAGESAERFRHGTPRGPLDGVPVTVKDSFHVRGLPRWHGSAAHDDAATSQHDSEPVARLKEAGAVIVAKTVMPDMGMLATGISSQQGVVRNPWDPAMSPGGSSAGAGASLAAGLGLLALGTDIAGSVRLPASQCGLASVKPTQGRIPYTPSSTMRSAGVMARSIADVEVGLGVVSQPAVSDVWSLAEPFRARCAASGPDTARIGLLLDMGYGPRAESVVADVATDQAGRLSDLGYRVDPVALRVSDADFTALDAVFQAKALAELLECAPLQRLKAQPRIREWCAGASRRNAAQHLLDLETVSAATRRVVEDIADFDYIVSPVLATPGFPAGALGPVEDHRLLYHANFTAWFNQTGQPAAVIRGGVDSGTGLPIGVQIVGRRFDDSGTLALARLLEGERTTPLSWPELSTESAM